MPEAVGDCNKRNVVAKASCVVRRIGSSNQLEKKDRSAADAQQLTAGSPVHNARMDVAGISVPYLSDDAVDHQPKRQQ